VTLAPFDIIADYLRGTRGVMLDIYKRPEELLQAVEALVPVSLRWGKAALRPGAPPLVLIPLHKGADGWLSEAQFKTFYWPTLRRVILGLVEEGLVPFLAAEGCYASRLEIIRDLPPATTVWLFEATDMVRVKEALGGVACVAGNVPMALLSLGSPNEVKEHCRRLIQAVGRDGGYILDPGAGIDTARVENLRAMIEAAREAADY
jgi:uroporphyrinogen-III decarboxylase